MGKYLWHSQVYLIIAIVILGSSNFTGNYVSQEVTPIIISCSSIVEFYNYWILSKMIDNEMAKKLLVYFFLVLS